MQYEPIEFIQFHADDKVHPAPKRPVYPPMPEPEPAVSVVASQMPWWAR